MQVTKEFAKQAMFRVWNAIAPDCGHVWEVEEDERAAYIAECCYDANRLQTFADLTPEEERAVILLGIPVLEEIAREFC